MLHITEYYNTTIIDNDIEKIIIDKLVSPLDNLPPIVHKITIKKSINIYKRQNKIPYNCELIIENTIIDRISVFNNKEDYLDITILDLSDNKITSIPEFIWSLVKLQKLNLSYNKITSIPNSIYSLIDLKILCLDYNQITSIPESISSLINLQVLNLHSNQITSIPESICLLVNLQYLDLNNNQITSIPKSISSLINLKILYLSYN